MAGADSARLLGSQALDLSQEAFGQRADLQIMGLQVLRQKRERILQHLDRIKAERQAKKDADKAKGKFGGKGGDIGEGIGAVIGTVVGGPAGTIAGAQAGRQVGSGIEGAFSDPSFSQEGGAGENQGGFGDLFESGGGFENIFGGGGETPDDFFVRPGGGGGGAGTGGGLNSPSGMTPF